MAARSNSTPGACNELSPSRLQEKEIKEEKQQNKAAHVMHRLLNIAICRNI